MNNMLTQPIVANVADVVMECIVVLSLARRRAPTLSDIEEHLNGAGRGTNRDGLTHVGGQTGIDVALVVRGLVDTNQLGELRDGTITRFARLEPAAPYVGLSRRRAVLRLAHRAVVTFGRAVRSIDVVTYAEECATLATRRAGLTTELIVRDLLNLARTKDLLVIGTVRGGSGSGAGINLYIPAALQAYVEDLRPASPLTWQDYVAAMFNRLWESRLQAAAAAHDKPIAISTSEIRDAIGADRMSDGRSVAEAQFGLNPEEPMTVIAVLLQLSGSASPTIRAIDDRTALWGPACVGNGDIAVEQSFSTNADRVVEAARRAMVQGVVAAFTARDVEAECQLDRSLAPAGKHSVARHLSDLAKARIADGNGGTSERRERRIVGVGILNGAAAYVAPSHESFADDVARGERYVQGEGLLTAVKLADLPRQFAATDRSECAVMALGRIRLIAAHAAALITRAGTFLKGVTPSVTDRVRTDIESRLAELNGVADRCKGWERFRSVPNAPLGILVDGPTLTPIELRDLVSPMCESAGGLSSPKAVSRYASAIRRVENPAFTGRRAKDRKAAAEFYFDRADALLYAAGNWGGVRCRLNAILARQEIGLLRDVRFALAALPAEKSRQRMRAVAAVAFLGDTSHADLVRDRAVNDVDSGVRETALWALGFLVHEEAGAILRDAVARDDHTRVRRAAAAMLARGDRWWWRC